MESQICNVQLMAYKAMSHVCIVEGSNMATYYEVSIQYTRACVLPETE